MQRKIKIPQVENYLRTGNVNISGRADKKTKTGVLHLYDGIGPYSGISARDFAGALKDLGDVDYIELHINSPGGSVFDGAAIYNMLLDHQALVDVRVDGLAASIASIIALAGDQITIAKNAMMMIHNPSALAWGGAEDMRKMAGTLDKVKSTLISVYADRMGLPEDEISQLMNEESWYTAKEAVDAGLADVVGDRSVRKKSDAKARARWADNPPPWVPDDITKLFTEEQKENVDNVESEQKENESESENCRAEYLARLEKLAQLGRGVTVMPASNSALNALQDKRMRIIKEMRDLNSSDAPLTDEQSAKWEELDKLQDDLGKKIENEKKLGQLVDSLAEIEEAVHRQPIKSIPEGGAGDYFASAEYAEAFEKYIRRKAVTASLERGQTSKGGALVPTQLDTKIREILYLMNPLREFCDVIKTTSEKNVPYTTNIGEARWISESAQYPETDDAFGRVLLKPEKVGRMLRVSEELLDDSSFDVGSYIAKSLGKAIAMAEEKAFLTGNGGGEPGGIIGSSGAASGGVVQIQTSVSRSLSGDDIIKIVYDLKRPYRRNAIWVINDKLVGSIRRLKGSDGHYLWQPGLAAGQPDTLLGYRIIETEYLPAPAANSLSAVFGDWSYYTICDRTNSTDVRRYNEIFAKTGEIGFRGTRRVDGGPILGQAFRALKIKA